MSYQTVCSVMFTCAGKVRDYDGHRASDVLTFDFNGTGVRCGTCDTIDY